MVFVLLRKQSQRRGEHGRRAGAFLECSSVTLAAPTAATLTAEMRSRKVRNPMTTLALGACRVAGILAASLPLLLSSNARAASGLAPNTIRPDVAAFVSTVLREAPRKFAALTTGSRSFGRTFHSCHVETDQYQSAYFGCVVGPYPTTQLANVKAQVIAALDASLPAYGREAPESNTVGGKIISWDDSSGPTDLPLFNLTTSAKSPSTFMVTAIVTGSE